MDLPPTFSKDPKQHKPSSKMQILEVGSKLFLEIQ